MSDNPFKQTFDSFSLPLYALIHDTTLQALREAGISSRNVINIMDSLPKLSLNSKEQADLQNANGPMELEDSFGSGTVFFLYGGSNEAYVFQDSTNVDYFNQIINNNSNQSSENNEGSDGNAQAKNSEGGQTKVEQNNKENQNKSQSNQTGQDSGQSSSQDSNQEVLSKLQLMELILKGNDQKQTDQNVMQQLLLLETIQKMDSDQLLKNLQMLKLLNELSQSEKGQQAQSQQSGTGPQQQDKQQQGNRKFQKKDQNQKNQNQNQNQNQDQDMMQTLQELQILKMLNSQN